MISLDNLESKSKQQLIEIINKISDKPKYGLVWEEEECPENLDKGIPYLSLDLDKSIIHDTDTDTDIVIVEGDNYNLLKSMQFTHLKSIDLIYIDPPYNTGGISFKYSDTFNSKKDKYKHSMWLNFMRNRLILAKNLLSDNGFLVCSIGEDEVNNLGLLLKDIFNNVSEPIVWLSKPSGNQNKVTKFTAICHEFIYICSNNDIETNYEELNIDNNKKSDKQMYSEESNRKKEKYPLGIFLKKDIKEYPKKIIEIKDKKGAKVTKEIIVIPNEEYEIKPYEDGSYGGHRFQARKYAKGQGSERYIEYCKKASGDDPTVLCAILGVNDKQNLGLKFVQGDQYFQSIGDVVYMRMPSFLGFYQGGYEGFSSAKPVELLKRIIRNCSNKNSLILDFFAGSGTLGEAVFQVNSEDISSERKVILCTNNLPEEGCICENVCYPRIIKAHDNENKNVLYFKIEPQLEKSIGNFNRQSDLFKFEVAKHCFNIICLREDCYLELYKDDLEALYSNINKLIGIYIGLDLNYTDTKVYKQLLTQDNKYKKFYKFDFENNSSFVDCNGIYIESIPVEYIDIIRTVEQKVGGYNISEERY